MSHILLVDHRIWNRRNRHTFTFDAMPKAKGAEWLGQIGDMAVIRLPNRYAVTALKAELVSLAGMDWERIDAEAEALKRTMRDLAGRCYFETFGDEQ